MNKAAIITDIHFGSRGDSPIFLDALERFFKEDFFPYLDRQKITKIFNLGDTFDKRKSISFWTYARSKQMFFDEIQKRGIEYHTIIGNHDCYLRNENYPNSVQELLAPEYPEFKIHLEPIELEFGPTKILWVPWINPNNEAEFMDKINKSNADILFGHFSIFGATMQRGQKSDHGIDPVSLKKFEIVGSGHFHHRSTMENIWYFGSPYQMTWNDHGNMKGFHIIDLDSRTINFIPNSHDVFVSIDYEEDRMDSYLLENIEGTIVRVNIVDKENQVAFDTFMKKIESFNPHKIDVIDKREYGEDGDLKIEEVKDTSKIISESISILGLEEEKKKELTEFFDQLYKEALEVRA